MQQDPGLPAGSFGGPINDLARRLGFGFRDVWVLKQVGVDLHCQRV